jgi:hypothetical protein
MLQIHFSKLPEFPCQSSFDIIRRMNSSSYQEIYEKYPRGDHLLWLFHQLKIDRKFIISAACDCVEKKLKPYLDQNHRLLKAIEVTKSWCAGNSTLTEVNAASSAIIGIGNAVASAVRCAIDGHWSVVGYIAQVNVVDSGLCTETHKIHYLSLQESAQIIRARVSWSVVEKPAKEIGLIES